MELKFKYKNGTIYAGVKPFKGRRRWVSMRTSDMGVARQKARESKLFKMQAVESVDALTYEVFDRLKDRKAPTVAEAIDKFLEHEAARGRSPSTIAGSRVNLNFWVRTTGTGKKDPNHLETGDFKDFINPKDGTKLCTIKSRYNSCVKFCAFLMNNGWMRTNKAAACGIELSALGQEERKITSHKPVTKEELDRLLAYTVGDRFWNLAILISWETGLRLSDICLLEKVSIVDDHLQLFTRKTNSYVRLPLVPSMVDLVNSTGEVAGEHEAKYLFPKEQAVYRLYGASPFCTAFKRIAVKAGIEDKTFHGLRTAFINRTYTDRSQGILAQLSAELAKKQTADLAGHKSTETTDIYLRAGQQ